MKARINCAGFLAKTAGFSCMTIGVYATISCLIRDRGPIKRDDTRLARVCGCRISQLRSSLQQLINAGLFTEANGSLSIAEQHA